MGDNTIGPAAFPAFAYPGVIPAFSASSCCPALRLTLAPRAVFPLFLRHPPLPCRRLLSRCAWASSGIRPLPWPLAACRARYLWGRLRFRALWLLWAVARVRRLSPLAKPICYLSITKSRICFIKITIRVIKNHAASFGVMAIWPAGTKKPLGEGQPYPNNYLCLFSYY